MSQLAIYKSEFGEQSETYGEKTLNIQEQKTFPGF